MATSKRAPLTVDHLRFSLIWVETNLNMLGDPEPKKILRGFLGSRDPYAARFDQVRAGQNPREADLNVPWEKRGQHFWEYYLENANLDAVGGQTAWRFLVPFFSKPPFKVAAQWLDGTVALKGFFYPMGFGLILTVRSPKTRSLTEAVELAFKIKRDEFDVKDAAGTSKQLNALQVAEKCLNYLRELALGPNAPIGRPAVHAEPFSVFTVVKGSGVAPNPSAKEKREIHRALEGVTGWSPYWQTAKLPKLDSEVTWELRAGTPDGHMVYARKRGRAVWFPLAFTAQEKRSTLSCYHDNLVLASLQVESLSGLASATAGEIRAGRWQALPIMHRDCARLAVGILGRLYGNHNKTYRSLSPRYHIRQNDLVPDVDKLRDQCNMPKLA